MAEYTRMKNKGKYTFDSVEREVEFERKKSVGWEEEYKAYRFHWLNYPERRFVGEYPLNVDIELTTLCNLRCPMCFTTTEAYAKFRKKEFMDMELYKRIIDEIANHVPAIRFSSSGEQTLHPQFIDCVRYAKEKGVKEVSMVTNGSKLKPAFIEELVDAGVDWVIISVDGMYKTYEEIRFPMKFEQIVEALENIQKTKQEKNLAKPVVQIQSIWPALETTYEEYYKKFKPITDLIQFGILIDYNRADSLVYEEDFCCPAIYQRLEIGFDGKAYPCCANNGVRLSIGDVTEQSIHDIWQGERAAQVRALHEAGRFCEIDMCKDCFLTRKLIDKEIKRIEDREFVVKEYLYKE